MADITISTSIGVWLSSSHDTPSSPLFHPHTFPLFSFSSSNRKRTPHTTCDMATTTTTTPFNLTSPLAPTFPRNYSLTTLSLPHHHHFFTLRYDQFSPPPIRKRLPTCKATEVSVAEEPSPSGGGGGGEKWVPVVPLGALPRGERRVIIQEGETILLLWYKDEVFAIENRSPAEGAYSEGLINAKLTKVTLNFIVYKLFPFLVY